MNSKINYLNFDIYAKRTSFFYKNQERIGSYFGLFLTLLYIVVSLILFIYYFSITMKRSEIKVYDSTLYAQEMPIINLERNQFNFAFGLEDPKTLNRFVDETIYYAEVAFIDRIKVNGQFVTISTQILPLEKCKSEESFGENYKHLFLKGELSNSYCLKDFNYNLTLVGGFKYERMSYIRIKIFPCKNTTENNYHCKPQEKLDEKMTSGYFSILLKDIGLNPSNYSNPSIPTLQDLYTTIDKRLYKNYILNFGLTEIQTDEGLFNEKIKTDKFIQFHKELQTFTFREESENLEGKDICLTQIRLDDNIIVQKRTYTKISEILSRIGGYMQLMNTVFLLISLLINKIDSKLKIINSIFNFNLKQNKITLKFKTLQSLDFIENNSKLNKSIIVNNNKFINIKTVQSENNKSNNNLIMKNNINNSNLLSQSINNNHDINKYYTINQSNINIYNKSNSFSMKNHKKNRNSHFNIYKKEEKSNNEINISINEKEGNGIKKEYNEKININIFNYLCFWRNTKKKKIIELYHFGYNFYKKRMDIVHVFSHLLLTEKILLKNFNDHLYSICKEKDLLYPET